MGGKTQQRVAGNVKPSSSGKIRELLINKHGVGNVITFSALSNKASEPSHPKEDQKVVNKSATQEPPSPKKQSTDKYTLVVKKVGNRDCFTRVKVSKEEGQEPSSSFNVSTSKKTTVDLIEQPFAQDLNSTSESNITTVSQSFLDDQHDFDTSSEHIESTKDEDVPDIDTVLDLIEGIKKLALENVNCKLNQLNEYQVDQEKEMIKILQLSIKHYKEDLSIEEWDLINRSLYKWIGLIPKSDQLLGCSIEQKEFCVDIFNFIGNLILMVKSTDQNEISEEKFPMMKSLKSDWNNFHSSELYKDLIHLYLQLASINELGNEDVAIVEALALVIVDVNPNTVILGSEFTSELMTDVEFDIDFKLPKNSRYCTFDEDKFKNFIGVSNLLKSHRRAVVVTTHNMLSKVMDTICENVEENRLSEQEQDEIETQYLAPPAVLMSILTSEDSIMTALLSDYKVGDISVTIEPNSDSYTCTLGYLLVWDLIIKFIVGMNKEVGHQIIHCLKKFELIQRLLDNVFMLLPPLGERDSLNLKIETENDDDVLHNQQWCLNSFLKNPLKLSLRRPTNEIELVALHVYFSIALHMPVTVRKWFNNNSNKRLCNLVNEYTVKHISSVICSLEMDTVQEKCLVRRDDDKGNLVVKARPNVREVHAVYIRDEFKMELTVKLPLNYPLGSVQIDGGKRVGVTDQKWRSWLLQLTTFLSHQNGPILDGIDLWRKNIDKRFEGVEKCPICYSILHSNYQLPRKKCPTCSHLFHAVCLYKWFASSQNGTCPLCRNFWKGSSIAFMSLVMGQNTPRPQ